MSLKDRLQSDLKESLRARDADRSQVLRFLIAELHNREIAKQGAGTAPHLTDEESIQIIQKEAKKRREAIELFRKGGRTDLISKEEKDLLIIDAYLPKPLSDAEIRTIVESVVGKGASEFAAVMRDVMKLAAGRAQGQRVGEIVKELLGK